MAYWFHWVGKRQPPRRAASALVQIHAHVWLCVTPLAPAGAVGKARDPGFPFGLGPKYVQLNWKKGFTHNILTGLSRDGGEVVVESRLSLVKAAWGRGSDQTRNKGPAAPVRGDVAPQS